MSLENKYNVKSPGVKRLMREACELKDPTEEYYACPLDDNLFEWHFTVRGPPNTEFEGGYYHGRILLPSQYPMHPPNIILLTPNGRFQVNKKICLSISGHHPESWQPSWSIRTALLALIAFMPTPGAGTIGSLDYTKEERQLLAKKSRNWECSICGKNVDKLSTEPKINSKLTQEESCLIQHIALKAEEESNQKQAVLKDNEKPNESTLRNRSASLNNKPENTTSNTSPQLVEQETVSRSGDSFWLPVILILVTLIVFLLLRRILSVF